MKPVIDMEPVVQQLLGEMRAEGLDETDLDDLVVDACCEEDLGEINSREDPDDQEDAISDAEARASDINNEGMAGQLEYLLAGYATRPDGAREGLAFIRGELGLADRNCTRL